MINKISMQSLTKLFVLILVIGLPIFIFSTNKASAALQHKCGTIKGVCTVNGLAYNVKSIYNDALRQFEWKCGFGKDIINCNNSKSKSSLIPPPGKDNQNNNKGDKEQDKGNLDVQKEYTETTTTSVTYKFCPCPTCGDKHYECSNGNPGKWSHAVEKTYSKEELDEVWHWRCTDGCGNVSGLCEERKGRDDLSAKCDESECKYETDCATCAKCEIGEPKVTTSYNGKCYWVCRIKDKERGWKRNEAWCSAEKSVEPKCGPGSGTIYSTPYSFDTSANDRNEHNIVVEYKTSDGHVEKQKLALCQPGYSICDLEERKTHDIMGVITSSKANWRCCYGGCESWRKNDLNCGDCHAQSFNSWITWLGHYKTTNNFVVNNENSTNISSVGTVGRGLFSPTSSWFH